MNIFSSALTLLLTSAAAANEAHDIIAQPHIARIVNAVHGADTAMEIPCKEEAEGLFDCLGESCIVCFVEIFEDLDEDSTCESLHDDDDFCNLINGCIVECGANDCTAPAVELETCVETNYSDAEREAPCPGLCDKLKEDGVTVKVPAPTDVLSFVKTGNDAHDIIVQPHIARIVNAVHGADTAMEIPCKEEAEGLFDCLGESCIVCFVEIFEDLDEDSTCESLHDDDDFCNLINGCVVECGANDCTAPAVELETCIETNYSDAEREEPCPGLCEKLKEDFSGETYKIA